MFSNSFDPTTPATVGTDQRIKRLKVDGVSVALSLWDTAGQERFQALTPMCAPAAHGARRAPPPRALGRVAAGAHPGRGPRRRRYFRGAQGVVYVYDVTRPETLESIGSKWLPDFQAYGTRPDAVQMLVANKIDLGGARAVSSEDGAAFARGRGLLFKETSAKTDCGGVDEGVYDALVWGMVATILDTPGLAGPGSRGGPEALRLQEARAASQRRSGCC
ncbi:YPTV3 [Scenedesmus sp. PABB004]|nr:YPTV3 [Scenedesmus sp. PABB004]